MDSHAPIVVVLGIIGWAFVFWNYRQLCKKADQKAIDRWRKKGL